VHVFTLCLFPSTGNDHISRAMVRGVPINTMVRAHVCSWSKESTFHQHRGLHFYEVNLMTLHLQNSPSSVFPPVFNDVHALTSVFPPNWRWLFFTCKCCHHPICRWIRWQASNIPVRTSHSQADSACPHERQRESTVCVMRTGDYSLIPDYQQQKRASSMFNAVGWSHWYVPNPKSCCKSSI
jgi:hypothetical protein